MTTLTEKLETSYTKILETSMRYKEVEKLQRILELIAQCKSRIQMEMNICDDMYGRSATGARLGNQANQTRIERYYRISQRLKQFYNNKLEKISKFV